MAPKKSKRARSEREAKDLKFYFGKPKSVATVLTANFASDTDSDDTDYKPSSDDDEVQKEKHPKTSKFDVESEWAKMQQEAAADELKQAPCRMLSPLLQSLQGRHSRQPKDRSRKAIEKLLEKLNDYGRVYENGRCPAVAVGDVKRQARAEEAAAQTSLDNVAPSRPRGSSSIVMRAVACLNGPVSKHRAKMSEQCGMQKRGLLPSPPRRKLQKTGQNQAGANVASGKEVAHHEKPNLAQKRKVGQEMSTVQKAHMEWKETRKTEDGLYNHRSVIEKEDFLTRVAHRESMSERAEHKKARHAGEKAVFLQEDANKRLEIAKVDSEASTQHSLLTSKGQKFSGVILLLGRSKRAV